MLVLMSPQTPMGFIDQHIQQEHPSLDDRTASFVNQSHFELQMDRRQALHNSPEATYPLLDDVPELGASTSTPSTAASPQSFHSQTGVPTSDWQPRPSYFGIVSPNNVSYGYPIFSQSHDEDSNQMTGEFGDYSGSHQLKALSQDETTRTEILSGEQGLDPSLASPGLQPRPSMSSPRDPINGSISTFSQPLAFDPPSSTGYFARNDSIMLDMPSYPTMLPLMAGPGEHSYVWETSGQTSSTYPPPDGNSALGMISPSQQNLMMQPVHRLSMHPPQLHSPQHESFDSSVSCRPGLNNRRSHGIHAPGKEKHICPYPECGKSFKDLKAHMLTHLDERPEKCPIKDCEYNTKGFSRKYDRNRHTLTHYKGTMVCGFCDPIVDGSTRSFNRLDLFKRHILKHFPAHEKTPNNRRKSSPTDNGRGEAGTSPATSSSTSAICSTCFHTVASPRELYDHVDDCLIRTVQRSGLADGASSQEIGNDTNESPSPVSPTIIEPETQTSSSAMRVPASTRRPAPIKVGPVNGVRKLKAGRPRKVFTETLSATQSKPDVFTPAPQSSNFADHEMHNMTDDAAQSMSFSQQEESEMTSYWQASEGMIKQESITPNQVWTRSM